MLPTTPRLQPRSMCSSCSMPFSTTATRVSRGVTLIRISSLTARPLSLQGQAPAHPAAARARPARATGRSRAAAGPSRPNSSLSAAPRTPPRRPGWRSRRPCPWARRCPHRLRFRPATGARTRRRIPKALPAHARRRAPPPPRTPGARARTGAPACRRPPWHRRACRKPRHQAPPRYRRRSRRPAPPARAAPGPRPPCPRARGRRRPVGTRWPGVPSAPPRPGPRTSRPGACADLGGAPQWRAGERLAAARRSGGKVQHLRKDTRSPVAVAARAAHAPANGSPPVHAITANLNAPLWRNVMSRRASVLLLAAALALPAAAALAQSPAPVAAPVDGTLLSVSATGEARRVPDVATLSAGVVTQAADANAALRANAEQMNRLMEAVREAGIAERDIRTSDLGVSPQYRRQEGQAREISGYEARNTVNLTVRDISALGGVIDALVAAGANQVYGPSFEIGDPETAQDEARRSALEAARSRAGLYADALGLRVRRIVSISEGGGFMPPRPMLAMRAMDAMESSPVSPGESTVSVNLDVVFELGR